MLPSRRSFQEEAVTIESQLVGTTTVLRVHGTLTANAGERGLREMIREAVADGVRTVVINLEDATAIDSSGVSARRKFASAIRTMLMASD